MTKDKTHPRTEKSIKRRETEEKQQQQQQHLGRDLKKTKEHSLNDYQETSARKPTMAR